MYAGIDRNEFKRVVENIISNSIKYSKSNVDIIIKKEDEKCKVQFIEYNTYLKEDDVDNMFDRFYKKDKSRTTSSTGLGLYIAKTIMKKMNQDIMSELIEGNLVITCILQ